MRFTYSRREWPPSLILPAVLTSDTHHRFVDADAKIDTAADITLIPDSVQRALQLVPRGIVSGSGARGERWTSILTYRVRIRLAKLDWFEIEVATSPNAYALIGRDILNRCILLANGPEMFFELALPQIKPDVVAE